MILYCIEPKEVQKEKTLVLWGNTDNSQKKSKINHVISSEGAEVIPPYRLAFTARRHGGFLGWAVRKHTPRRFRRRVLKMSISRGICPGLGWAPKPIRVHICPGKRTSGHSVNPACSPLPKATPGRRNIPFYIKKKARSQDHPGN